MDTGEKKNSQLSAPGATSTATTSTDRTIFPSEGDCVASTPAGSPNICEGGAVAYAFSIRVTAQVPLTHVRQLRPGVSRLQRRPGRLVSAQAPRLTTLLLTRTRRDSEQFA